MTTNERPAAGGASEAWRPESMIRLDAALADVGARLLWLDGWDSGRAVGDTEGYARGHVAGYDRGRSDGYDVALAEAEADLDQWRDGIVRRASALAAAAVPFAELAERRGQPERAARQRELLRERGVTL